MKFIVVTGSIISGIGKGVCASSIGLLLQSRGLTVTSIKIDPYLNIDSGTLSPFEHGECFVLTDGGETDLDLGNYERFLDIELTSDNSITTGKVYDNVLKRERHGGYLGKSIQVVPHITNEIKRLIMNVAEKTIEGKQVDVVIIETGGTCGDLESMPFIEALRLFANTRKSDFCFVHVSMIIYLDHDAENQKNYKTKPTQHSFYKMREQGINPDILVMRTPRILNDELKEKLSLHCGIDSDQIISNIDVRNIYSVPKVFEDQQIFDKINRVLKFKEYSEPNLIKYNQILKYYDTVNDKNNVIKRHKLFIVGKYVGTQDTYLSIIRAVEHAVFELNHRIDEESQKFIVDIEVLDAEKFDENTNFDFLLNCGVIIAGGFSARGIGGKMMITRYCRENNVPILGICLGMQIMVSEYARNVCGIDGVSDEWTDNDSSADALTLSMGLTRGRDSVICMLPDQNGILGGTMRLGNYTTNIQPNTKVHELYGQDQITERHRHRYEINNAYVDLIQRNGLSFVGTHSFLRDNQTISLMEITELKNHAFYIGCQFHPEFKSRFNRPQPLFVGLIRAMVQ